ncbi:uncharacterized protein LOC130693334 isoform X2 [Daphnia carinata]|uniref:uncharacterized protein LOC130693334 isoform X2 n=1 Tax=Daphnia carinata TaxID=120202 RepID=UPI0028687E0E|nr:uncharacterized protein LOC130693334 isoform X2 [Daphnia carinata]
MNPTEAEEAWQQEKEFLDYMFVSLRHGSGGDENGAAESSRIRRTGQQQQASSISCITTTANNTDISSTTNKNLSPVKPEAGLDHLDNLCKLMEQLGELRDANTRLQKRVHYLEDMKTLQEMHQELDLFVGSDSTASTSMHKADAGADRSLDSLDSSETLPITQAELLGSIHTADKSTNNSSDHPSGRQPRSPAGKKIKSNHHMKFKKPGTLLKYRERSKSVGFDENVVPPITSEENEVDYDNAVNASTTSTPSPDSYKLPGTSVTPRGRPKTKVSKWTRVKEAFRWEKAHVDQHQANSPSCATKVNNSPSKHPEKEEAALSRQQVVPYQHSLSPESPGHVMARSPSPVFRLGRRRRSTTSRGTSTSSSSLSECPLESEILKSFADAQELPLFHLEKRPSSPEVNKLLTEGSEEESGGVLDLQRGYVLSLPQMKRLHRQSTVSCDGNFATSSPSVNIAQLPERIPESQIPPSEIPSDPIRMKGPESPNRRKTSKTCNTLMTTSSDQQELVQIQAGVVESTDENVGSFISNLRSQLKPINEWTSKWHCDLMKNSSALPTSPGAVSHVETSSRSSLSVPSTPNQHQAFTFDEFPEAGLELGAVSRENSPGGKKNVDLETAMMSTLMNSNTIKNNPGLLLNSISPEFRKKVEVWERLKSGLSPAPAAFDSGALATPPTPTTPHQIQQQGAKKSAESPDWSDIGKRRSEPDKLPPAFKKKLAEWEIRKAVAGKSDQNVEELHKILPHDFNRKLQEWERMKQQQAAAGKMSVVAGNQSGLERQGSGKHNHHSRGKQVKSAQKTEDVQQHRGEKQKEKDLQWLEKELQKIEREKLRLEREREKYIERESRLEKIREAMKQPGHGPQREICIRTSTGEFRFQGLSRKFTKKLFQWEEQKGIRPEASTIALLDGAFSPSRPHHHLHHHHPSAGEFSSSISARPTNLSAISRSKSESSVADLVSASVHSQPSSLSLNDAETTADFDRRLAADQDEGAQTTPGPGALLVEVEDVTEDCATVVDIPEVQPQAPIYSIAPAELRQTIQSEQDEQPRFQVGITGPARVERNDSVRTEASFKLLEENLSLLDRLRAKGEIVKYLELQMTSIDGDMAGVANTQTEEMVRLKEEETCLSDQEENNSVAGNTSTVDRLKRRIVLLESRGQQLKSEKEHLQAVYQKQCSQQVHLVQHLVGKMQQLRDIGNVSGSTPPPFDPEALQRLDTLTTEILQEAQTLENSMRHSQRLPTACGDHGGITRQTSSAVRFPEQLSIKANQLKEEYERLRSFDSDLETNSDEEPEATPTPQVLLPQLPPVPSEMSSAARKKVFVETHRLVFAPLETNVTDPVPSFQATVGENEAEDGEVAPWRRNRNARDQANDAAQTWRMNSLTTTPTEESPSDQCRPMTVATVRNTAPNIRRMIDKYHQRVTASGKDRSAPTFQLRSRCDLLADERSSSSTPPPTIFIENKGPGSPPTPATDSPLPFEHAGQLHPNCMVQLSKSLSAGAMNPTENQRTGPSSSSSWKGSGVLRSQSGLQLPSGQVAPCVRNPSFFRKSPLDPSIDDLLQKYRCRRQVGVPAELPKSPTSNPERMLKLKQAREAFLTVGPGAIQSSELRQSEERAQSTVEEEPQSISSTPGIVVQDITFDECAEQPDTRSCRSQEGSVVMTGAARPVVGSSVPSSPAPSRRSSNNDNCRSRDESPHQNPVGRRSWLKQPSKFFFSKTPKTP